MKLHNPNGLVTLKVKKLSTKGAVVIEKLSFDGIIWNLKSFTHKWFINNGTVIHFCGLRFMRHIISENDFYLSNGDSKLLQKYK